MSNLLPPEVRKLMSVWSQTKHTRPLPDTPSELSSITQNGLGLYRTRFSLPTTSSWADAVGTQNTGKNSTERSHCRTLIPCFPAFPHFWLIVKDITGPSGSKKRASTSPTEKEKARSSSILRELLAHSCFSSSHPTY